MSICLYSQNRSVVKKSASIDTHTHKWGRGKEGREQGQPATTNNGETKDNTTKAENKQREHTTSRQNKERKGGKAGGESTQEPNPGTQKSRHPQAQQAPKQNHSSGDN